MSEIKNEEKYFFFRNYLYIPQFTTKQNHEFDNMDQMFS